VVRAYGIFAADLPPRSSSLAHSEAGVSFAFAGHELDPRRQELRRAGAIVHVEPQVFDLLAFLIRNRDRIVSKDEILEEVWHGRIVSEAALSSRINAARKAIGDNGNDQILIKTFHKRGFRFVGETIERAEAGAPPQPSVSEPPRRRRRRPTSPPSTPSRRSPSSPSSISAAIRSMTTSPTASPRT
jgi:DNA-binding winged helix-turn-helix (wHTH) protein